MRKRIIGFVVVIVLAGAFFCGYRNVNRQFPETVVKITPKGEQAEYQEGVLISVEGREFASEKEKEEIYEQQQFKPKFDKEYMKVRVTFENVSEEEKSVDITELEVEADGFANGLHDAVVLSEDGQEDHMTQNLKPGEKRQIELLYGIISTMYSKRNWEKVKEDDFYLTYTLYPKSRCWHYSRFIKRNAAFKKARVPIGVQRFLYPKHDGVKNMHYEVRHTETSSFVRMVIERKHRVKEE